MKKLLFLTLLTLGLTIHASAQGIGKLKLSIGPELLFAAGDFSTTNGLGIGATAQLEVYLKENLSVTGITGFNTFLGKSAGSGVKYKNATIIPIRVGGRYYVGLGFHLGAQVGVGFVNTAGVGSTGFAYSPQVGYNFKTLKGKAIDATLKYDGYAIKGGSIAAVGIRLAYVF
jgi:hypothetical protein